MNALLVQRRIEIDLLRSVAIIAMIVYHLLYDLQYLYGYIGLGSVFWLIAGKGIAGLFLLLVGISFCLSWQRSAIKHESVLKRYGKYFRRGLGLFAGGLIISLATYAFDPVSYVRFGILHLIGVSILVLPLMTPFGRGNLLLGLLLIAAKSVLPVTSESIMLLPLGIPPSDFASVDYFPLIPWLGVVLIGYAVSYGLYVHIQMKPWPYTKSGLAGVLAWPGRYALLIYFIHQLCLLAVLRVLLGPIQA